MDGMYGAGDFYADKALMSPENLMMAAEYGQYQYENLVSGHRFPGFESDELGFQCSAVSESASINVGGEADHGEELASGVIKARIASHPSYPKLLDAYIDCQKVCVCVYSWSSRFWFWFWFLGEFWMGFWLGFLSLSLWVVILCVCFLKVGAPPEIACVLDEIRREKDVCKHDVVSMCFGVDPELDEFMVLSLSET